MEAHALMAAAARTALPRLAVPRILREDRADGSFVLRSREPLAAYDACIGDWLLRWAERAPQRTFMAERADEGAGQGWRSIDYGTALEDVRRLAQGLLLHCRAGDGPVVAVSDNSLDLGLLGLAAMYVGRPLAVVSSSYVRMTRDYARIHAILQRLDPALVYAEDGDVYGPALAGSGCAAQQVYARRVPAGGLALAALRERAPGDAVQAAHSRVGPDTVAKLLLTSGSTGQPKVVVNTHRMLCANQQMIAQCWPFLDDAPPVVLDWLPWSHTFGANHNFNLVLRNGGTLYIDDGRPAPDLVGRTVRNLREVRPTLYFNVPRGFDMLLPHLEADADTARALFSRLDALFYAAAALPASTWRRLEACAASHRERPLFFTTAWGATETAPLITSAHFPLLEPGNVGVPAPGVELKFVPARGKLELRVRGVSVFREYRHDPERTAAAFDEEGFYRLGDAGRPADPADPCAGVIFDGRVAEDFKLSSGTWVSVGQLRLQAVSALAPLAMDAVVAGHDRDEVGLLLFATPAMRALAGDAGAGASGEALSECPAVREAIRSRLAPLYAGAGSSQRASRVLVLAEPPSLDAGEITDKGYVNQQAVLQRRAVALACLYSEHPAVIRLA